MGQRSEYVSWEQAPTAEEMQGREIGIEQIGYQEADFRVMLPDLDMTPGSTEAGLFKRWTNEELTRLNEDGELYYNTKWDNAFERNAELKHLYVKDEEKVDEKAEEEWARASHQRAFQFYLDKRSPEEKERDIHALEKNLEQIINRVKASNAEVASDLKEAFTLGRAQKDMSPEAGRSLANMINKISDDKEKNNSLKQLAIESLELLLKAEVTSRQQLIEGRMRSYESLSEGAQHMVKDWYIDFEKGFDIGTINRNVTLRILTEFRSRFGAPHRVFPGHERDVYDAWVNWNKLSKRLQETSDSAERDRIVNGYDQGDGKMVGGMKQMEEHIEMYTSKITANVDKHFTLGPTGLTMAHQTSWAEIKNISKLKINPGESTIVSGNASFDNWEMNEIKFQKIYFERAAAENALSRIISLLPTRPPQAPVGPGHVPGPSGPADPHDFSIFGEDGNYNEAIIDAYAQAFANSQFTEVDKRKKRNLAKKGEARDLHHKLEGLEEQVKREKPRLVDAEAKLAAAQKDVAASQALHQAFIDAVNASRTYKREDMEAAGKKLAADNAAFAQAEATVNDIKARLHDLEDEILQLHGRPAGTKDKSGNPLPEVEGKIHKLEHEAIESDTEQQDRIREAKLEQGKRLIKALLGYVRQDLPEKDIYAALGKRDRDVTAIAKLAELGTTKTREGNLNLESNKLISVPEGGKFAFLNAYRIPDFVGRVPTDILDMVMANPERFPGMPELIKKLEGEGRIIICLAQPITTDVDGGVVDKKYTGSGQTLDMSKAEKLKKQYSCKSDADLFALWLSDLAVQEQMGMRPEEMEERYAVWMAENHLLRDKHFSASKKWTFITSNVVTSTGKYFETMIRRMTDAGYSLTIADFGRFPFKSLERGAEYAWTAVDESGGREVHWRNKDLHANPEAPQDVAERLYTSLMSSLQLYHQRSKIGGQTTNRINPKGAKGIPDLGNFIAANLNLLEKKMMILRSIYEYPRLETEQRIEMMLQWRRGEQIHDENGDPLFQRPDGRPDAGMIYLTYDIMDFYTKSGYERLQHVNPELWEELNANVQWQGKLNTEYRKALERHANTVHNPNATIEDIRLAEADLNYHLNEMRNFKMRSHLLGMQASGKFSKMSAEEISIYIADMHSETVSDHLIAQVEYGADALFGTSRLKKMPFNRRLLAMVVGYVGRGKIADWARAVGTNLGIGDQFLRNLSDEEMVKLMEKKFDDNLFRHLAAHLAFATRAPGAGNWKGLAHPSAHPSSLFPRTEIGKEILNLGNKGRKLERIGGGVKLDTTTQKLIEHVVKGRIKDDILEAVSRTIRVSMNEFVRAGKSGGWDVDEVMRTYLNEKMNDKQRVRFVNGEWEYRQYESDGTPIGMVDEWLGQLVRERMGYSLMPGPSPEDARFVPLSEMRQTHESQYQEHLARAA